MKKTTVVNTTPAQKSGLRVKKVIVNAKQESVSTGSGKVKTPASDTEKKTGVNFGQKTGMRVMAYQDFTLARNDEPKFRLTDTELAADWRAEFPQSRAVQNGRINEEIVRGVRNLYNQGTSGHGTSGVTHQSRPYVIDNGKRVTSEYTRARKVAVEAEAPAQPKKIGKTVKPVVQAAPVTRRVKVVARKRVAA